MLINNYEFFESAGDRKSPVYRFANENAQVQRNLFLTAPELSYANILAAAQALVGYATVEEDFDGPGGIKRRWISRSLPAAFACLPSPDNLGALSYLWCTSIASAEPASRPESVDGDLSITNYDWYRLSTLWETRLDNLFEDDAVLADAGPLSPIATAIARPDEGDALRRGWEHTRFITRQVDAGSRTVTARSIAFWALQEGVVAQGLNEGIAIAESRATVRYVWLGVPYEGVPFATINGRYGYVNDAEFDGFAAGTLLNLNSRYRQYRSAFGQRLLDYSFEMMYQPHFDEPSGQYMGWNSALRVVNGQKRYWPLSADGTTPGPAAAAGVNLFPYTDFSAFFRPSQT